MWNDPLHPSLHQRALLCNSRSLDTVSDATLDHFRDAAEKVVEEKGAVTALAAALAVISGSTEIKSRSLLNSQEVTRHENIQIEIAWLCSVQYSSPADKNKLQWNLYIKTTLRTNKQTVVLIHGWFYAGSIIITWGDR